MFPMKLIEDYKVLSYYPDPNNLEKEVQKRLKDGWTLLGSVQTTFSPEHGLVYTQVMIKVADK